MIHTKTNTLNLNSENKQELLVILMSAYTTIQGSALPYQGTMGCCLSLNNKLYGITNYHVVYGEHSPAYVRKYLAGTVEVSCLHQETQMNSLHRETSHFQGKTIPVYDSTLDYALFDLTANTAEFDTIALSKLGKPIEPHIGMDVYKTGAATGLTYATVDASSRLDESLVILRTDEKNASEKLCDYGDSGSLWVYDDGSPHHRPVALHAGTSVNNHTMGRAYSFAAIYADICSHVNIESFTL